MSSADVDSFIRLSPPVKISDYFNLSIILFILGFFLTCAFFM